MENNANATDALFSIPTPAERGEWLRISMAAKSAGIDYEVWQEWCRRGDGFNENNNRSTWNSIKTGTGIGAGTLYRQAKQNGWQPPQGFNAPTPPPSRAQRQQPKPEEKPKATTADIVRHIQNCQTEHAKALPYLDGRGITAETAARFKIGFNSKANAIVIPFPELAYYVERFTNTAPNGDGRRYNNPAGYAKPVFNIPALRNGARFVFVTEGQLDAITIEQGGGACIGSNEAAQLTDELKRGEPITAEAFFIVPDNDKTGFTKAEKMATALTAIGKTVYYWPIPEQYKDVNDWQTKDPEGLKQWIEKAANVFDAERLAKLKEYQDRTTQAGSRNAFVSEVETGLQVTQTGFNELDRTMGGGLTEGLVIMGAKSSMGKTTFALQIADQIAGSQIDGQRRDILYFSLEQRAAELMAKSVSRRLFQFYQREYSALEIRTKYRYADKDTKQAIKAALDDYTRGAGRNVYVWEARGKAVTADVIRQKVAEHTAITGQYPIVFVDYLQILSGSKPKMDTIDILDEAIKGLTAISRDFKTTVIAISSYNRASYHNDAAMEAFNGSSKIEYSADVLLSIQPDFIALGIEKAKDFDEDEWKRQDIRKVELKILKNRNGLTGERISYQYKPKCDTFIEVDTSGKIGHMVAPSRARSVKV